MPLELWTLNRELKLVVRQTVCILPEEQTQGGQHSTGIIPSTPTRQAHVHGRQGRQGSQSCLDIPNTQN